MIEKAIEIEPAYMAAWQNLGNVFRETGKVKKAESCYRMVTDSAPEHSGAWSNLCIILKHQRRLNEARAAGHRATALDPGNKLAWYGLANAMKADGLLEDAVKTYQKAIDLDSKFMLAHEALCNTTYIIESRQQLSGTAMVRTRSVFQRWLEAEPESPVSRHVLSAFSDNDALLRAPDDYIVALFDKFSESFDHNLASLDYRVPDLVSQRINNLFEQPGGNFDVLDAGCGTGLLAASLRPWARHLLGVDLSSGMLSKARKRRLYDELIEAELSAWLRTSQQKFDLIVCADTLIYFGEMNSVLRGMARVMKPKATLIFSIEQNTSSSRPYVLSPSGRYSHREDYIRQCLDDAHLLLDDCREEVLRQEGGQDVNGFLLTVNKAGKQDSPGARV